MTIPCYHSRNAVSNVEIIESSVNERILSSHLPEQTAWTNYPNKITKSCKILNGLSSVNTSISCDNVHECDYHY